MNKRLWIDKAAMLGIDQFEIYESTTVEKEMTWFQGQVDTLVSSKVTGVSIRGVIGDKMANMALEKVEDSQCEDILEALIEQGEAISSDSQDELRKPQPIDYVKKNVTWHMADMSDVRQILETLEKKMLAYDSRVIQVGYLGYSQGSGSRTITNSLGLDVSDEDEMQYIGASVVVQENEEVKDGFCIEVVYDFDAFDLDGFVKKVCDKALNKLGASSIPSCSCPVIFEKDAMTSLFASFTGLFNGELMYKGISPLKDKFNEMIFSEKVTVIDDPKNTDCLSVANFDDEGCPTKSKTLVDHGKYVMMLHDTRSAKQMDTESTGNGFKSGYASGVGVRPMNCYIEPGEKSFEELCQTIQDGFVVTDLQGLHAGLDFVSTNFSLQCQGFWVKNGKKEKNVTLVTVANNFLDMMKHVIAVGNDLDWSYHSVCSPSIAFEKCTISGE